MRTFYFLQLGLLLGLPIPALAQTKTPDSDLPTKVRKLEAENEAIKKELRKLSEELAALKAQLAPTGADSMDTVYMAMKLTPMTISEGPFKPGDLIKVEYGLKNSLAREIRVPITKEGRVSLGIRQHWIERLGKDASIPAIPDRIARSGRRYGVSGYIIPAANAIPAGHISPFELKVETKGFPPGTYRIYAEYRDLKGKTIQTESVEFELVDN